MGAETASRRFKPQPRGKSYSELLREVRDADPEGG